MSKNDFISCADMVTATFSSIERSAIEKNNKLFNAWKKIITAIHGNGQNIYEHTSIVDVKNGILLLETDHPGWIQLLQMNSGFIVKGLKMYAPGLNVSSLSYRLKGSNAGLHDVNYKKEFEYHSKKMAEHFDLAEEMIQNHAQPETVNQAEMKIPEDLADKLNALKQNILTRKSQ